MIIVRAQAPVGELGYAYWVALSDQIANWYDEQFDKGVLHLTWSYLYLSIVLIGRENV